MKDYNDRYFRPVLNSDNGEAGAETVFHYRQEGNLVWATYGGGRVRFGTLIARVAPDGSLDMRYQHMNSEGDLLTGVCRSVPEELPDGRLRLHESWRWTCGDGSEGKSVVEEFRPAHPSPGNFPESQNLDDYLVSDDVVDWKTPAVLRTALDLAGAIPDEIEKARRLYEWVRDTIPHTNDAGLDVVTCSASEVLRHGTGICFAKSHLLAALLRAVGIPAGFCYQVLRLNPPTANTLVLHGFNGIYLRGTGKWVRVDARGNTKGIDAQFDLAKERLAFDMDPSAGEFTYDTIFHSPAGEVVERLKKHRSRRELWSDLPGPLGSERRNGGALG